jgi:hypothetical protein
VLVGLLATGIGAGEGDRSEVPGCISFLTSPDLRGRAATDPRAAAAASYLASRLEALGLLPAGDPGPDGPSFFQVVPAVMASYDPDASWIEAKGRHGSFAVRVADHTRPAKPEDEEFVSSFDVALGDIRVVPDRADLVEARGALVFAGFGIRAPEYGWDDYKGIDVRDKVVLVFSGEPEETKADSKWNGAHATRHAMAGSKQRLAASLGAKALLVVPNPAGASKTTAELLRGRERELASPWLGLAEEASPSIPVVYLDRGIAKMLLQATSVDLDKAGKRLASGKAASRDVKDRSITVHLAVKERKEVALENVVARLGGKEAADAVLMGAHWDHLGMEGTTFFPGADDDASGVAAVLEAARRLRAEPPKSGSEIYVAFWSGEEEGRLGSRYFAAHPPRHRIVAAVNLDMLGRNNMDKAEYANVLQVIYSAQAPVLREIAKEANVGVDFDLRFYGALRFQPISDHASFAEAGIPIVYPFSGYHGDYHTTGDTADKLILPRIERSARFVEALARRLAERHDDVKLDASIQEAPKPDPFERGY